MHVLLVKIQIKPEQKEAFIEAMLDDARGSVKDEPGCLRFDVIKDEKDPNCIYLYEVYRDKAAFEDHLKAPHFIKWRDTVKDWFAAPAEVWQGPSIFPPENAWNKQTT
jgi:quinol monooxygenase YgiN